MIGTAIVLGFVAFAIGFGIVYFLMLRRNPRYAGRRGKWTVPALTIAIGLTVLLALLVPHPSGLRYVICGLALALLVEEAVFIAPSFREASARAKAKRGG